MFDFTKHLDEMQALMNEYGQAAPDVMGAFGRLNKVATAPGVLDVKTKELIGIGISIGVRCESCLSVHVGDAIKAGATDEEIAETIGVAILMGGGPSLMFGMKTWEAVKQFRAKG